MSALSRNEFDPSKKAGAMLEYVLRDTDPEVEAQRASEVSISEELHNAPLITEVGLRTKSRIVFITREVHVLRSDSPLRAHIRTIASGFAEVHVIVLATIYEAKKGVLRDGENVWFYTTGARSSIRHYFAAKKTIKEQLVFAEGFRPDIVVALEPFVAGFVGCMISEKYGRPFQLHIREDFTTSEFKESHPHASWYLRLARFVFGYSTSIRVSTQKILEHIEPYMSKSQDVQVLPKFMNIQSLTNMQVAQDEKDLFPNFSFVIAWVGPLDAESTLFRAIDATRSVLFAKSIGLAVVGDGPRKEAFVERARILGVAEQIVFYKDRHMLTSVLSQADVLLCTDTDETSDLVVVQAAAQGVPLIVAENAFRSHLFVDGEDAFLCPKEDTVCFSQKLTKLLNTPTLRPQFTAQARETVQTRIHEDPETYISAYRGTIESVFTSASDVTPDQAA